MTAFAIRSAVGVVTFMLLDGLWLGLLMTGFYRTHLAPIARMSNGGFAPDWSAALAVYLCLGTGIAVFVVPRAGTLTEARTIYAHQWIPASNPVFGGGTAQYVATQMRAALTTRLGSKLW